jgi:aminoglycoside phosphotransferase (APT) family kinase protein
VFNVGPLLASGRDADIFEFGPDLVVRRSREGRSMTTEVRTMRFLYECHYPVPRVDDISDDGTEMVMERVFGVNMVASLNAAPWRAARFGKILADLHVRLHEFTAPEWLAAAPFGNGTQLLHLDLHPLNVMMAPKGPVVIDWGNAVRGDPETDVALTWALIAAGEVDASFAKVALIKLIRSRLARNFIGGFDRDTVRSKLDEVVEWKVSDAHLSATEIATMRSFARGGR